MLPVVTPERKKRKDDLQKYSEQHKPIKEKGNIAKRTPTAVFLVVVMSYI
jgi:hypothetical protein